jgi:signal transduction histidine kinase
MEGARVSVGRALLLGTGLLIVLEGAALGALASPLSPLAIGLCVLLALACLGLSAHLVRAALWPLVLEAERTQELAVGGENALPSVGTLAEDAALRKGQDFRRALAVRTKERSRLNVQADDATRYKAEFLRSVRHELRTPLNSILGFSDVLLSGIEGPLTHDQRESLLVVQRTGKRLRDLFDEVLDLAASPARPDTRQQAVELGPLLEQAREALEEDRGLRAVHVRLEIADGLPPVAADEQRLRRLLRGLAGHAFAVSQGALLELGARVAGERVQITVRDPERRLSQDERASLVGPDVAPTRRKGLDEGSRLRLAIFRELAELDGARLEVVSGEDGTAFVLELPVWSAQ